MTLFLEHIRIQMNGDRFNYKLRTKKKTKIEIEIEREIDREREIEVETTFHDIPLVGTEGMTAFMCLTFLNHIGITGISKMKASDKYGMFERVRDYVVENANRF